MPNDDQPSTDRPGLTAAKVVAFLGISRSHAYRHAEELGAYRVGRRVLFDPDVVEQIRRRPQLADRPQET